MEAKYCRRWLCDGVLRKMKREKKKTKRRGKTHRITIDARFSCCSVFAFSYNVGRSGSKNKKQILRIAVAGCTSRSTLGSGDISKKKRKSANCLGCVYMLSRRLRSFRYANGFCLLLVARLSFAHDVRLSPEKIFCFSRHETAHQRIARGSPQHVCWSVDGAWLTSLKWHTKWTRRRSL